MDQTTKDQILAAFEQAPPYVKELVNSGKYTEFMNKVRILGNYHADVLGNISDEILMMLLGMSEPVELMDNLQKEAGITQEEAGMIVDLANDEIFGPLRESLKKGSESAPVQAPRPALVETPAVATGYYPDPTRPNAPAPAPLPVPPPAPIPVPVPPAPVAQAPIPPVAPPPMRTMVQDIEQMGQGGATPPPVVAQMPPVSPSAIPTPVRPAPEPPPPYIPPPVPPPPPPQPTPNPEDAPNRAEIEATLKRYGIDPYREPVE